MSRRSGATTATWSTTRRWPVWTSVAGSRLVLLWGAANRDPSHFDDANEFRLDRPGGKGHISFGKGAHFCVGAALARLEARIVIGELLERTTHIEASPTPAAGCRAFCATSRTARTQRRADVRHSLKRPANPRSGRSALVTSPGGAATTDVIALRAGIPVTVMPIEAKFSGFDRSTPGFGKIMCLL